MPNITLRCIIHRIYEWVKPIKIFRILALQAALVWFTLYTKNLQCPFKVIRCINVFNACKFLKAFIICYTHLNNINAYCRWDLQHLSVLKIFLDLSLTSKTPLTIRKACGCQKYRINQTTSSRSLWIFCTTMMAKRSGELLNYLLNCYMNYNHNTVIILDLLWLIILILIWKDVFLSN